MKCSCGLWATADASTLEIKRLRADVVAVAKAISDGFPLRRMPGQGEVAA